MKNAIFSTLGLSEKETSVFLKMMELGAQPVSVVARNLHMPRSSVYAVTERLSGLGILEKFSRHGITYVKCIAADSLGDVLEEKKHACDVALQSYEDNLPKLRMLENRLSITPKVKFFEGKTAVKKMYADVLKEKEFCAFFNPESIQHEMPEFLWKIPEMLRESGGKARELLVDGPLARQYQKKYNSDSHQILLFPENRNFQADWIIGASRIYLVSYGEREISGTEIESSALLQTQRVVFEELWGRMSSGPREKN